ncbi:MAG: hypothetical protein KDA27_25900 [Candidatus Eisenbacteria bacterium]|uniref:Uncharacterized protein n=1 Tax=Eiseniibacteriota bacterium TaxID=2212470 RepID=A0A956NID3_UNCEI|nr:hypothetical protein [Candidatus Eisenbacteria bacterium]
MAYLGVEIKVNAGRFLTKSARGQLGAFAHFTKRYVGSRTGLLVAAKGSANKSKIERELAGEMIDNGVVLFLLTLLD